MQTIANLLAQLRKGDPLAQKAIYDKYSSLFFAICLRYIKNSAEAEDVMIESFFKIFSKIHQYKDQGSFEGWMKRIVVNQALMSIRKNSNLNLHVNIENAYDINEAPRVIDKLSHDEILELIQDLPVGYRTVFNLYVIEGYKHREIAEKLGISINTSKSQLILAKRKLRALYKKKHNQKIS
ncbi:MAG: RNA polymerase sigma factor [Saprospiraceae bacterium]|nr:RNA polymerase sigma factor [Bacteroidia bacterium]MBT8229551.1 RNA polymerase sigma factor [Bacteroidia bacterium]NNF21212.1 RNA polymerase sigma factor [Saprospiraceae bacterium]NNK90568.1 RNA polymerase sigma factor [Saprospiraceae bacterium]